jgi:GxxExxY protein
MNRDPETYVILGAAMRVHSELGRGFLESVYQDALEVEFREQKIPYRREVSIPVFYHGIELASCFVADFICFDSIIVELKALMEWGGKEKAQVLNYLKATGHKRGLLINFGKDRLEYERIANFFDEKKMSINAAGDTD